MADHRRRSRRKLRDLAQGALVQLGCGDQPIAGWVNIDLGRGADLVIDLRGGFPAPRGRVSVIYSEHVFEHFDLPTGLQLMRDCQTALEPGGVMRIAMPDLQYVVERYRDDWREQAWLGEPQYAHIDSAAHMLNVAMREWGHQYLYDEAELTLRLRTAGFDDIRRVRAGESDTEALCMRETRPDSLLVVEARVA